MCSCFKKNVLLILRSKNTEKIYVSHDWATLNFFSIYLYTQNALLLGKKLGYK